MLEPCQMKKKKKKSIQLTLSCTSRLALWTNTGSLSIMSWLVSCAAVLLVLPSWLFSTVANSLAAF